jgi:hypothetical protein
MLMLPDAHLRLARGIGAGRAGRLANDRAGASPCGPGRPPAGRRYLPRFATVNRRWVALGVWIVRVLSSSVRSGPRSSKRRTPSPRRTGGGINDYGSLRTQAPARPGASAGLAGPGAVGRRHDVGSSAWRAQVRARAGCQVTGGGQRRVSARLLVVGYQPHERDGDVDGDRQPAVDDSQPDPERIKAKQSWTVRASQVRRGRPDVAAPTVPDTVIRRMTGTSEPPRRPDLNAGTVSGGHACCAWTAASEPHRLCVCDLGRKVGVKASATLTSGLAAHACGVVPAKEPPEPAFGECQCPVAVSTPSRHAKDS